MIQYTPMSEDETSITMKILYDSVFAQAAYQFCGHLDEYLIHHTRHLALMRFPSRYGREDVSVQIYREGCLVEERQMAIAKEIIPYYFQMWRLWSRELSRFSRLHKGTIAIFTHPLAGVGMSFRREVRHVFWQWDYFPDGSLVSRLFNFTARHVAKRCWRYCPLTSAIGKAIGKNADSPVMLGVRVPEGAVAKPSNRLLMVGQLRKGQGVEHVLDFIASDQGYSLSLIGAAAGGFEKAISSRIDALNIQARVFFPNRFFTDAELQGEAARCCASLALYDVDKRNLTNYADPGKVKSSIEMGLPVIMTRISDTAKYIERFGTGVVIDSINDLPQAIKDICANQERYQAGLVSFARHFYYEDYYDKRLLGEDAKLTTAKI